MTMPWTLSWKQSPNLPISLFRTAIYSYEFICIDFDAMVYHSVLCRITNKFKYNILIQLRHILNYFRHSMIKPYITLILILLTTLLQIKSSAVNRDILVFTTFSSNNIASIVERSRLAQHASFVTWMSSRYTFCLSCMVFESFEGV
jgi:hypothetical protein